MRLLNAKAGAVNQYLVSEVRIISILSINLVLRSALQSQACLTLATDSVEIGNSRFRCARLEGRPQATWCRRRSFETPCFARLLRIRSVGLNFNWSDLICFMESIY